MESGIFPESHIFALENRAFREGILSGDDFIFSEVASPLIRPTVEHEDTILDLLMLYDELIVGQRSFDLENLNQYTDAPIFKQKPETARRLSLLGAGRDPNGILDGLVDGSVEKELILKEAADEAQYLLRRNIDSTINAAKIEFESVLSKDGLLSSFDDPISHESIVKFIKRNLFWMVDIFSNWFWGGTYNHLIDSEILREVGISKEIQTQFKFYESHDRFASYLIFVQESYIGYFESSLLGRLTGFDVIYDRTPDKIYLDGTLPDYSSASRVIRINLADVCEYFPMPRNIEEALEFRQKSEIQQFRSLLKRWLASVSNDIELERKLRKELQIANRDIKRVTHIKNLQSNPLFFGIKTLASNLPILNNIVSLLDVINYFYTRRVNARTAWVAISD